jgi:D-glycerate 3-kinase
MTAPDPAIVEAAMAEIDAALAFGSRRPVVFAICGAQGCGKTTLAAELLDRCEARGLRPATLSIDDLYLTRAERMALARQVHPLLQTRGVPGTHDIALGLQTLAALDSGESAGLPRFDKHRDDRLPPAQWPSAPMDCEVLIFEGWCAGARPQAQEALAEPINALEARDDPDGIWRRFVNDALAGQYQELFARFDRLMLLAAPGFDVVHGWRLQQEREAGGPMDSAAIARFIAHYERLTRHILTDMPNHADCVVRLDARRRPLSIRQRTGG